MARARNIKPSFFKNEILGKLDPLVSILFISLWTLADREGRLEDRPDRILAETFPYRREITDINRYLTVLVSHGFIHRYEIDGLRLIQIAKFNKHQNPHNTEKASELPEYSEEFKITVTEPVNNSLATADSLNLIPDSPNLIPDVSDAGASSSLPAKKPPKADPVPYAKIIDLYHEHLPMCPHVRRLDSTRKKRIHARWDAGELPDLETWKCYFIFIGQSKFLTGKCAPAPGKKYPFLADFNWITNDHNFSKIWEKKYHED